MELNHGQTSHQVILETPKFLTLLLVASRTSIAVVLVPGKPGAEGARHSPFPRF